MPPIVEVQVVEADTLTVDVVIDAPVQSVDVAVTEPSIAVVDVGLVPPGSSAPVALSFPFSGQPTSELLVNVPLAFALTVPANLVGTVVYSGVRTTADATFTLNRVNGAVTALGTITITPDSDTSCVLAGSGGTLVAGDVLQIVAPTVDDATLADVGITVLTQRA